MHKVHKMNTEYGGCMSVSKGYLWNRFNFIIIVNTKNEMPDEMLVQYRGCLT